MKTKLAYAPNVPRPAKLAYDAVDWSLDFRQHADKYIRGRGEFGVLMYQPYKNEILPFWKYKDEQSASASGKTIYDLFLRYVTQADYNGADMARKFLQMGFTRSMRYAKYPGGKKYGEETHRAPPDTWYDIEKRKAALVFKHYWDLTRQNKAYTDYTKTMR